MMAGRVEQTGECGPFNFKEGEQGKEQLSVFAVHGPRLLHLT